MNRTVAVILAVGCGANDGTSADDPEDTDLPTDTDIETPSCIDEVMVTYAEGGCLGYSDQWEFKVDNAGCAASGTLALWDTIALDWDEKHPLTLGSEAPNGEDWQNWVLGPLPHATPEESWSAGVNTAFHCVDQASSLTTSVRLLDADGSLLACAIWGQDPNAVLSGTASFLHTSVADLTGCEERTF